MRLLPVLLALAALAATAPGAAADALDLPQRGTARCGPGPAAEPLPAPAPAATRARAAAGPSVGSALARSGLPSGEQARLRADLRRARSLRGRLPASRARELGAAVAVVEGLARRRLLSASRARLAFEQLRHNSDWWARSGPPAAPRPRAGRRSPCAGGAGLGGSRVTVDGIVLQWYPGQGLQVQQLATAGRANALARACLPGDALAPAGPNDTCDREALREALAALDRLAVRRGRDVAWEYLLTFGGGVPPWTSGMAQATAMQALVRGGEVLGEPAHARLALRGLGLFRRAAPRGVRAQGPAGPHFLLYSFSPGLRVFNAFLQTLVGLDEVAARTGSARARALFAAGDREARREVPLADTGAWSRYSIDGAESDLGYHRLVRDFLRRLCERTSASVYCATAERFTRYQHERARVRFVDDRRISLSKVACVTVRVRRGDVVVATASRVLRRGVQPLPLVAPARPGRYVVAIDAEDLNGHHTRLEREVVVRG